MVAKAWASVRIPLKLMLVFAVLILLLQRSAVPPGDPTQRVRFYTRDLEFDYIAWTFNAFWVKFNQSALGLNRYLADEQASETVIEFIDLTRRIQAAESDLRTIFSDPAIEDPNTAGSELEVQLAADNARMAHLGPLAESIVQSQVVAILRSLGISTGGHALPPVLYHVTPVPMALIVARRDAMIQENNISVQSEMTLEEQIALEDAVAQGVDASTLVVPIGGIGIYPTMVTRTSSIHWLMEVVAHEWAHNYFFLRPLGMSYLASPEMRTMNEAAAGLIGKEIGSLLIARYYPAFAPPPPDPDETEPEPPLEPEPPAFDFRAEMRETYLNAERLLAEGEIEQAEQYMELRRLFLWDNGYRFRKLNQAYFAFYGAYADTAGGAAVADPIG
ncbi:MAG TPA: hypothetical protein VMN57_14270, partial [Anaerolineales bacterium]|nr:hypothetical protein [Anaerolineales bacterium]